MGEYLLEIEGKHDLNTIGRMISGEEAGGSAFISSAVSFYQGRITNLATFRELRRGRPKKIKLLGDGAPQPPETEHVWSGVMLANGTNTAVSAYRTT